MKKTLLRRIRWTKIGCILSVAIVAGALGYRYYQDMYATQLVEYRVTVEQGDTLWGVVGQVATDKDDMSKLTWQAMRDNHIENPGELQPGTELVIRVKAEREL